MVTSYEDLPSRLAAQLPELRPAVEKAAAGVARGYRDMAYVGAPPAEPGTIYGEVLLPFLHARLRDGGDGDGLARAFRLIEELAGHPDTRARNVVGVTILEAIDRRLWRAAYRLMGPTTRRLVAEMRGGNPGTGAAITRPPGAWRQDKGG